MGVSDRIEELCRSRGSCEAYFEDVFFDDWLFYGHVDVDVDVHGIVHCWRHGESHLWRRLCFGLVVDLFQCRDGVQVDGELGANGWRGSLIYRSARDASRRDDGVRVE